jgi:hypothetical protein
MGLKFSYVAEKEDSECDSLLVMGRSGKTDGDAYGLLIDVSNVLKGDGATGPRSWGVGILGSKESGEVVTAGADDALLRISGSNYTENGAVFKFRGLNANVNNRDGGILGELSNNISISLKDGSTTTTAIALMVDAQDLAATAKTEFGGLDVALNREGLAATTEYGVQVRTRGTINSAITAALRFRKDATDYGFSNLFSVDAEGTLGIATKTSFAGTIKGIPIKIGSTTYYIPAYGTVS